VLEVLQKHPEITKVSIEGHTDDQGAPAYNKRLSKDRAAAVVKWLVQHGIDKARLDAKGFGMERPLDTNSTEDGRALNRRVELHIVEQTAIAAPVPVPVPVPVPAPAPPPPPPPPPVPAPPTP
jgi:outer membrane protein OmpA-like peptidoglycan-associated protein